MAEPLAFKRRVLVYIPAFNCSEKIISVLDEVPEEVWGAADFLVVDNCSTDGTADRVLEANAAGRFPRQVNVIRPPQNLGYAGSQKLAYKLALSSPPVERVIMLHGDGQYAPELLGELMPYVDSEYGVVYGYRDKDVHGARDETPPGAYMIITGLGALESAVTGYRLKEWHTGFVMYGSGFLKRVDLDRLTSTYHIDGHMLFAASALGERLKAVPIWKRYKEYTQFVGLGRVKYVFQVLGLLVRFRLQRSTWEAHAGAELEIPEYAVLSSPGAGEAR